MSAAALEEAVDRYFSSISREKLLTEKTETGETDKNGKPLMADSVVQNALGEPVTVTEFLLPPTRRGLLHYLSLTEEDWHALSRTPAKSAVVREAEARLIDWRFQQILSLPGKDIKGLLFDLEQNYSLAPPAAEAAPSLSLEEKRRCLRELCAELCEYEEAEAATYV